MLKIRTSPFRQSFKDRKAQGLRGQDGMAMLEMIPIIIIVLLLVNFSIGFFGVIHTGILNSIAARNYAFETFRHRSNLTYFTTNSADNADKKNAYDLDKQRMHVTLSEKSISAGGSDTVATSRTIDFFTYDKRQADEVGGKQEHNNGVSAVIDGKRFQGTGVNPVWIKTGYGICLSATCGG